MRHGLKSKSLQKAAIFFWKGVAPSALLSSAVGVSLVISFALPYIPLTARLFSFTPLPWPEILIVFGLGLLYLLILVGIKVLYYRRTDKDAERSTVARVPRSNGK